MIKKSLSNHLLSIPGWRTDRKIIVIESDDWGSVRMPSKEVYYSLIKKGIRVDQCHYCKNDSLETESDINALFEILSSAKDIRGNFAQFTANAVVANPDFVMIKSNKFEKYYFKEITKSFKEFKGCQKSLELLKEGVKIGLLSIQSHGREHLNINRWMSYLRNNSPEAKIAFDYGVYGISTTISAEKRKSFLPAFDFETTTEESQVNEIAIDGLKIFNNIFGYKSSSFIAPNYVWSKSLENAISKEKVMYIQGNRLHTYKVPEGLKSTQRLRYFGKKNGNGQLDLIRNATFEPSESPDKDWVDSCLNEIKTAFFWKHPVVICSHRVNYMGSLNEKNRNVNLQKLKRLLFEIKKRWPDVEFMSSDQLGQLITQSNDEG